jgi:hypothetical protein
MPFARCMSRQTEYKHDLCVANSKWFQERVTDILLKVSIFIIKKKEKRKGKAT